ncbi:MAG: hypothetical protein IJR13_07830 [Bacteroidales bacterium]|nr:hypothetical protein [Bacteroidales bacterium]
MLSDSITYTLTNLTARDKTVRILINRSELLHDISNMAYVEGDIMETEDDHQRHQVFDIIQDGNIDRIERVLNKSYTEIEEATYPYSKREVQHGTTLSDMHEGPRVYSLLLTLPKDFAEATLDHMVHLIHEYMVCAALSDWMSITLPTAADKWTMKKETAMDDLRRAVNFRIRRVRRTMSPF